VDQIPFFEYDVKKKVEHALETLSSGHGGSPKTKSMIGHLMEKVIFLFILSFAVSAVNQLA
jgi:hypothetical protein